MISIITLITNFKLIISLIAIIPIAIFIFSIIKSPKNIFSPKKIIIAIVMLILVIGAFYFIFKKEPSSKYASKAVAQYDKKINQYNNLLNNYDGLNTKLINEANKIQAELKELYESAELTKEEKAKIEKALADNKDKIEEIENNVKDSEKNISILNGKLIDLEAQEVRKKAEIQQKEEELKNTQDEEARKQLKNELNKLYEEDRAIVKQIVEVKIEIGKLGIEKNTYISMLGDAERYKKQLQTNYNQLTDDEIGLFSQITKKEDRLKQIKTKIDDIKKEQEKIKQKMDELKIERQMAERCKLASDDWDKEHEFSFGNVRDAIFTAFDKYTDYASGRLMLKTASKTTQKVAGAITKTALTFHEGRKAMQTIDLLKERFFKDEKTPRKMTQETYESICRRTDDEYKTYGEKFANHETEIKTLLEEQKDENLENQELKDQDRIQGIEQRKRLERDEYTKIVNELNKKIKEVGTIDDKNRLKEQLEEAQTQQDELINATKDELKSKSPNFNARNNRAKNMRYRRYGIGPTF